MIVPTSAKVGIARFYSAARIATNFSQEEYEEIARRYARTLGLTYQDIDDILDYLCSVAGLHSIFYLWRPFLPDPGDDMLLELAVEAGCNRLITQNLKDFAGIDQFGVEPLRPADFLKEIGAIS